MVHAYSAPAEPTSRRVHDRFQRQIRRKQVGKKHDVGNLEVRVASLFLGAGIWIEGHIEGKRPAHHATRNLPGEVQF
jgi:hypothetical protein